MAEAIHFMSATNINPVFNSYSQSPKKKKHNISHTSTNINPASNSKKINDLSLITTKKSWKSPRRLITISTSDGRWNGEWNCDYLVSLRDLQLQDLVEDDDGDQRCKDSQVSISLCVHKHASFGFSVDGRIITSFTRKCTNCSSPYCREIDTSFNVWVLLSSREDRRNIPLPEVIYVKPGKQADLDSLIQDTIRLTTTVKDTCSESCEKSEPTIQYIGAQNKASIDKRWGRLLELKNSTTL